MQPLFSQLDVASLTHRLDFVRPSEVRRIQNANITEIGSITTHTPSDLQKKTGLTLDFSARLITACDRLIHNQKQQQQNGNSSSFQSLASVLNQRRNFGAENNENNNNSSTSSPLLDLPWHFSRCRSTGIEEIDQKLLVEGGFPHGQISEIFGLPGCGKTQLTMLIAATCTALPSSSSKSSSEKQGLPKISLGQNQSMMTMNNSSSISPPILVIDTEGSWSNERVLTFCETYYSSSVLMKNQSKENENDINEDDVVAEAEDATPSNSTDLNPSEALHRIQFIRSTDLATVTSALLLFRQRIHHHVKILTREMVKRHQQQQQQQTQHNNSTSSEKVPSLLEKQQQQQQQSIEEIMKQKIAQERELFERYEQKIRANYGGVLIIDSIAALLKENRIDDNFLHQTSLMGTTSGGGGGANGVSNIVKTQTIAAFSRLIQSITNETNTATIITNQMVKKRQQQQQQHQSSSSSNTSQQQQQIYNNYYVPALGEIWSSIPSIRCSIKKVPGAHFTSPMRIFSMIRGGSLLMLSTMNHRQNQINDENDTLVGDEDDGRNEDDDLLDQQKQQQLSSTNKTSCQFIIDADFLRSPPSKTNNDNENNETIVTTITAHHEAKRRERKVDNNGGDGSNVPPPTNIINHHQTSSQQSSFAVPEPPVTTTTTTSTANEQPTFVQNPTTKKATSWFAKRR